MRAQPPRLALILQVAYPTVIIVFNAVTFPETYADAQRFMGPPYYLPYEILSAFLCAALFLAAFLQWRRSLAGWLLSVVLDGSITLCFGYFAISDHKGKWPMPGWVDLILLGLGGLFAFIPILLLTRSSLAYFGITADSNEQASLNFSQTK